MAEAEHVRKVVGIKVELTMAEALALVNTAERLGSIVDANDNAPPGESVDWEAQVGEFLGDGAERDETETFFSISRAVGPLIKYTPDSRDE